jgi:peroxiredoxin
MTGQSSAERTMWIVMGVVVGCLVVVVCCVVGVAAFYYTRLNSFMQAAADRTQVAPSSGDGTGIGVGNLAPDFSLDLLNSGKTSLSDFRGHPILVNFWATWCSYCVQEMPIIQDRFQRFGQNLVILAVDEGDSANDVSSFIRQSGYTFAVLLDPDYYAGNLYRISSYPMSFFIDQNGIIRYIADGMMLETDLDQGLSSIGVK